MTRAYPIFFVHSSVTGLVVCSHILAAVNKAAENEGTQVPLGDPGSSSFG